MMREMRINSVVRPMIWGHGFIHTSNVLFIEGIYLTNSWKMATNIFANSISALEDLGICW